MGFDSIDRQYRKPHRVTPHECVRCQATEGLESRNIAPPSAPEQMLLLCSPCFEFHKVLTEPCWWWASGDENWAEEFIRSTTREQAMIDARAAYCDTFTLCYSVPASVDTAFFDGGDIIEWFDVANGAVEMDPSQVEVEDLESMLAATFTAWRLKHRLAPPEHPEDSSTTREFIDDDGEGG